jgi:hypothetical protein
VIHFDQISMSMTTTSTPKFERGAICSAIVVASPESVALHAFEVKASAAGTPAYRDEQRDQP